MSSVFVSIKDVDWAGAAWIDTRFSLQQLTAGRQAYDEAHIANAVYWDLEKDLSAMELTNGRHPLPSKEQLTTLFQKSGLEIDQQIYIYDDGGSPFAARAWSLLKYAGFPNVSIVLEGFTQLQTMGVPTNSEQVSPIRTLVQPNWQDHLIVNRDFVEEVVEGQREATLLDARSAERYVGKVEPIDPIAGHIPGALNFDWEQLKQGHQFVLDADVKERLQSTIQNRKGPIAVYCGSGVTAAPLFAALHHLQIDDVKLYVGSYSDWISKEGAPVGGEGKNV